MFEAFSLEKYFWAVLGTYQGGILLSREKAIKFAMSAAEVLIREKSPVLSGSILLLGFDDDGNCRSLPISGLKLKRETTENIVGAFLGVYKLKSYVTLTLGARVLSVDHREELKKSSPYDCTTGVFLGCFYSAPGLSKFQKAIFKIVDGNLKIAEKWEYPADAMNDISWVGDFFDYTRDVLPTERTKVIQLFEKYERTIEVEMNHNEVERMMKENGFWMQRESKNGALWTDGNETLLVGRKFRSPREYWNLEADVKRAVKKREKPPKVVAAPTLSQKLPIPLPQPPPLAIAPPPIVPKTVKPKERKKAVKYDMRTRAKVWERITELYFEGFRTWEIAEKMATEDIVMPDGSAMAAHYISSVVGSLQRKGVLSEGHRAKYFQLKAISNGLPVPPNVNINMPQNPPHNVTVNMPENRKEEPPKIIDVAAIEPLPVPTPPRPMSTRKLPDSVINILTDPELSDSQKVKMITAWMEI